MVKFLNSSMQEFIQIVGQKNIICFGAGRCLKRFVELDLGIEPLSVVDNYVYLDLSAVDVSGVNIPVWSPDKLLLINPANSVIVVTTRALEDIIEQLDQMENLNGILCFFSTALEEYNGLDPKQRNIYINQVTRLENRTYEEYIQEKFGVLNLGAAFKKYQVWENIVITNTAGSKARYDVREIAGKLGYEIIKVHSHEMKSTTRKCNDKLILDEWNRLFNSIPDRAIMMIQSPVLYDTKLVEDIHLQMKLKKGIRFIYIIHDLETLRKIYDMELYKDEIDFLKKIGDFFIVHNDKMGKYLVEQGFNTSKICSLQIFDYLFEARNPAKVQYDKSITIAGNLSLQKSPYLLSLRELNFIKIHLYGANYSGKIAERSELIEYHGAVSAEDLPELLNKGFGLIWDGDNINTCSGTTGQYLQYNNPHKLSLYLSAGMPVIIWSGAAAAEFVNKYQVGFTVDSLYDLKDIFERISEEQYKHYAENARNIATLLKAGVFTQNAIERAEKELNAVKQDCNGLKFNHKFQ